MVNRNIIALGFVSFFTDMASAMVTTILPIFIVYILDEGIDKLGFVVAIATFVSYAFRILFGYMSDRYRIVKPFVVTGYLISAITKPMLYLSHSWQSIALLRGTERMGKAIRSATKDSLISAYSEGKSGRSFGFHKMMDVAGEMSGAVIAFATLYYLGKSEEIFRDIFAWTIIPGILSVAIVIFFVQDAPYREKKSAEAFDWREDNRLLPMLFIYFAFIFFIFNDSFFIVKAKESGVSIEYIPLLIVLYNFTQTILSYFFGVQIDRFSSEKILAIAMSFGIFAMSAIYLNQIIIGFILLGVFTVASLNAMRAFISDKAKNRGTIYGIFYGGIAISSALGSITIGLIWEHFSQNSAIIFSLCGVIFIWIISIPYIRGYSE